MSFYRALPDDNGLLLMQTCNPDIMPLPDSFPDNDDDNNNDMSKNDKP